MSVGVKGALFLCFKENMSWCPASRPACYTSNSSFAYSLSSPPSSEAASLLRPKPNPKNPQAPSFAAFLASPFGATNARARTQPRTLKNMLPTAPNGHAASSESSKVGWALLAEATAEYAPLPLPLLLLLLPLLLLKAGLPLPLAWSLAALPRCGP